MKVLIKKLRASDNPKYPTAASQEKYDQDKSDSKSVPVDYEVVVTIGSKIQVGESIHSAVESRNGIKATGIFSTSPITSIEEQEDGMLVETNNSVYIIKEIQ